MINAYKQILGDYWDYLTRNNLNHKEIFIKWSMKTKQQQNIELKQWLSNVRLAKLDKVVNEIAVSLKNEKDENIISLKLSQVDKCKNLKKQAQQTILNL